MYPNNSASPNNSAPWSGQTKSESRPNVQNRIPPMMSGRKRRMPPEMIVGIPVMMLTQGPGLEPTATLETMTMTSVMVNATHTQMNTLSVNVPTPAFRPSRAPSPLR